MARIFLIALLLISTKSFACSCSQPEGTLREEVKRQYEIADAVLIGKAVKIEYKGWEVEDGNIFPPPKEWGVNVTDFEVIRAWKGDVGKSVSTKISPRCCRCPYLFKEGVTYLLFLYGPSHKGNYRTNMCSLTGWLEKSQEIVSLLDESA